jgi:cytochrome c oxidase cbb3-type subunit 1
MTHVPTTARTAPSAAVAASDATAYDAAARGPLLLLLGSGIVWLVVSGLLALITSIQLHSPHFLAQYSFLTYGRAEAMRETAFIYGWAANVGLGVAIWILGRLGGTPLRALNWAFGGAAFWNLGLLAGVIGIAVGDLTSFSLFQLPRYVQPIMVIAYGAISISGILAWMGRRTDGTYASQWYAVAALFLFPWLSSIAQYILLWVPSRGVAQNVAASWYAQGAWTLWLAPLALAAAYYLVPKLSGRILPNYDAAPLGFWTLIFVGAWTGGRHLIGGPVPAWIATLATVASVVLLVHYAIVAMNLRGGFRARGTSAAFVRFGVVAYLLAGVIDAIMSFRGMVLETQFTFFAAALEQLALYAGVSMIFFGAIYFMVPRLTGHAWSSIGLTLGHRVMVTIGVLLLVVTLAVAGWSQGTDLLNPKTPFADIIDRAKLPLLILSGAQLVLLGANLLLLVNFLQTISASVVADVVALNPIRESEVSAT